MSDIKLSGEKILISNMNRVGIVHLQGVKKYLEKYNPLPVETECLMEVETTVKERKEGRSNI